MSLVVLESVGSLMDLNTGMTYPMNRDGSADIEGGVHVTDCLDEWIDALDSRDRATVDDFFYVLAENMEDYGTYSR